MTGLKRKKVESRVIICRRIRRTKINCFVYPSPSSISRIIHWRVRGRKRSWQYDKQRKSERERERENENSLKMSQNSSNTDPSKTTQTKLTFHQIHNRNRNQVRYFTDVIPPNNKQLLTVTKLFHFSIHLCYKIAILFRDFR